jgi:phospholipase D1/2
VRENSARRLTWLWLAIAIVVMVGLALVWRFSPLSNHLHLHSIVPVMRRFSRESRFAFPIFACVIAIGNLAMVPINFLLIAVALVFPGWKGFLCGMLGALLAAVLQYYVGRWLGAGRAEEKFGKKFGERFENISHEIAKHGLSTVILLALIPVGPNVLTNLVAGICRIALWKVIVGTFIGFLPGLIIMNLLSRQLRKLITHPSVSSVILGVGLLGVIGLATVIAKKYIAKRYKFRMDERYREQHSAQPL